MTTSDSGKRRVHGMGSVYYDASRDRFVGSYEAGWTVRGTRRRRKVSARTQKGAEAKLLKAIRAQQAGDTGSTVTRTSVKRWSDQWLEIREEDLGVETLKADRSLMKTWIVPTIGHRRLDQLTPGDIRAVSKAITDAGRAPTTARRAHAILEKMLKDAMVEGHDVPQRALLIKPPAKAETDRDRIPTPDALALLEAASARPDSSRWAAALLQGMRPAECHGLTWDAVDFTALTIDISWQLKALPYRIPGDRSSGFRVPRGHVARQLQGATHLVRPKSAAARRVIPLVPWMTSALATWRDATPGSPHRLVWPCARGLSQTAKVDAAAWVQLQDAAQVARVEGGTGRRYELYECRHTTATLLREAGVPDETIIAILGHASILSTRTYIHTDEDAVRKALADVAHTLRLTT